MGKLSSVGRQLTVLLWKTPCVSKYQRVVKFQPNINWNDSA
ncbi:hypothetical protein [Spirosoma sp. KNUC1025]